MIRFVAFMQVAKPATRLQSVLISFGDFVALKIKERGLRINRDQLAEAALKDVERMLIEPDPWAKAWLAEFRSDPNDDYMVANLAHYCPRLHNAYKNGIEQTRPN
jgi:hypothetical protein